MRNVQKKKPFYCCNRTNPPITILLLSLTIYQNPDYLVQHTPFLLVAGCTAPMVSYPVVLLRRVMSYTSQGVERLSSQGVGGAKGLSYKA